MPTKAAVLLVDDNADNLMALAGVLEGLAEEVVAARSGLEALRHLLHREFAVILLDVRMPEMDGFETAELIRQRKSSEHTPIIFITAYAADEVPLTGYALGAVDFITKPVKPEILRSKVAVFVDLFKKARQINRQAEALKRRAEQLHQLTQASLAINGAAAPDEMLDIATRVARELVWADEAVTLAAPEPNAPRLRWAVSVDSGDRRLALDETAVFVSLLDVSAGAVRRTSEELASDPRWTPPRGPRGRRCGRIATPLTGRDGRNMGWLCAAGAAPKTFSAEDESLLTQLAQVTSIALENALYSEAREANRLKDEFLTTLSHELRTPLTAIVGWVRLLRDTPGLDGRFTHGLDVIARNVAAQARLIEDLLDVSRILAGKLQIDPGAVFPIPMVEAVVDAMTPTAEARGVSIAVRVDPALSPEQPIAGDPDRLQQVVWNLMSNALKFTARGGHVDVAVDLVAASDRPAFPAPREAGAGLGPDKLLRLRVTDNGQGIDPAFLGYVFDRFRQADSSTTRTEGGLGIGLALVRHIVELHGGTVSADSQGVGQGATFTVLLPMVAPVSPASRPVKGESWHLANVEKALRGLTILLVDDAADAREVMGEVLRRAGASVETAASADEALGKLEAGSYDLLVSDIGMPGGDGLSLIRRVRTSLGSNVPALAVTAYAREEDHIQALQAGFNAHLAKPVEPMELVGTALIATRRAERVPRTEEESREARNAMDGGLAKRRILIVEDDEDSRDALKEFLELSGHTVGVAGRGSEGVEIALRERPEVALVDIGLPDMDGHEVARRIRGSLGTTPIYLIALTGYAGSKARASALEAGFDAHVAKPVSPERLEVLLQNGPPSA